MKKMSEYGVNEKEIRERFVDDVELYESCLMQFLDDSLFADLGNAIKEKNYNNAFDYAHTLKGVASNLGLKSLYSAICDIVEPLRSNDYSNLDVQYKIIIDNYESLKKLFNQG